MFARWAECSPTSESSPLEKNLCPPLLQNYRARALRLLVAKDESFAFGSASSVGRPGQPSPSSLVKALMTQGSYVGKESEGA